MNVREIRIISVAQYIEEIEKLPASSTNNKSNSLFFRGHADSRWTLKPSLFREQGFIEYEHTMFRDIVVRQTIEFSSCISTLDYLVKMQHYGMPTRLLDLTSNPLVALYFACENLQGKGAKGKEGEVVMLQIPKKSIKHYDSDRVAVLSNLAKCKSEDLFINLYSEEWENSNFYSGLPLRRQTKYLHHLGKYYVSLLNKWLGNSTYAERLLQVMDSLKKLAQHCNLYVPNFPHVNQNTSWNEVNNEIGPMRLSPYTQDMVKKLRKDFAKGLSVIDCNYRNWFNKLESIQLLLHQISLEKNHFLPIIEPYDLTGVCVVQAKQDNQRIRNQMGSFILFGLGLDIEDGYLRLSKNGILEVPEEWKANGGNRFIIAPENKKKIIDELARIGISKSFIYPEFETIAAEIKNLYK